MIIRKLIIKIDYYNYKKTLLRFLVVTHKNILYVKIPIVSD